MRVTFTKYPAPILCRRNNSVAGNITRDDAKNLRIEEYNALFGMTEGDSESARIEAEAAKAEDEMRAHEAEKARQQKDEKRRMESRSRLYYADDDDDDDDGYTEDAGY